MTDIYKPILNKIGSGWYCPANANKIDQLGEFSLCDELEQMGVLEKRKEQLERKQLRWYFRIKK